jgi:hypothetical protein
MNPVPITFDAMFAQIKEWFPTTAAQAITR